ncbi:MAG: methylmalonyl-CoA mutase family protein [Crocinitomicaceae bacterium]|nr:methylmalonyl-CoA mutase family protein [Crocinitomicaceae bacterium]
MNSFFKEFNPVGKQEWIDKIHADLKGKDPSLLEHKDKIEEIDFSSVYHISDQKKHETPGGFPFTRGIKTNLNDWKNTAYVQVSDEKEANTKILHFLMTGADALWIVSTKENIDWNIVLNDVEFEHINAQFSLNSYEDMLKIQEIASHTPNTIHFNFDFLSNNLDLAKFGSHFKENQQRFALVNGFGIQQCGGTTWQEIAFCLNTGHEYLLQLMESGLTIDEASACIGFHIGIGGNYFYEIAKIRSLRALWAKIVQAYSPEHNCSHNCSVTAVIGHTNKSLSDPHTNLLRQTTEIMSALSAGIESIVVLPHDLYSDQGVDSISERMAINIPLILKEESYLDKVIDPIGGSYALEELTDLIGKKAWAQFQSLEQAGGLFNSDAQNNFKSDVQKKRALREEAFLEGETLLIGINNYSNPDPVLSNWKRIPTYLGMDALNYERITKTISA